MGVTEDDTIAETVLKTYHALPTKYKPVKATQNYFHWVPLSGIVAVRGKGMKCLPINQVTRANGSVLHDWHAEIVALRAFNHLLLHECLDLAASPTNLSHIVRRREPHEMSEAGGLQPFSIRDDLRLHMYSSEAPCGDASMELLMETQADPTPWPVAGLHHALGPVPGLLRGRESFAELGIVRRKPARADSPQTLSKSCSDKLALKQCTSILSSHTSLLVNPANAYLESLILPKSQYVAFACDRSFGPQGRMKHMAGQRWSGGYSFRPFKVKTTTHKFPYSRRSKPASSKELRSSNVAAVCNPRLRESLVLGRLQGRQKLDPRGASAICSKWMWMTVLQVLAALGTPNLLQEVSGSSHIQAWKQCVLLVDRQRVKADARAKALPGWIRNEGDNFEVNLK
ncbi:MAG: hypothetical protein L6R35_006628 [Caloplaca aegaea]|nr:MAG: hypothetical protein L6R35_006628 [Caloplaca aegaea]